MSILAEGKFVFADVWHGTVRACRNTILVLWVLGVFMLVMAIFLGIEENKSWFGEPSFLAAGVFFLVFFWRFMAYRSRATLKRSPSLQGVVRFQFDESGYQVEAVHARAEVKWAALVKWIESKNCFLLYQNPKIGSIVPKRFFQSAADLDAVRRLLQANVRRK
jgi:YcxB-like protein